MKSAHETIEAALRLVNRELWIVTSADGAQRGGLVATWVSSASIDPSRPVMLVGLAPNHFTCELVERSGVFGLHLISASQLNVAWEFALGSGRTRDKFAGLATMTQLTGAPLLADCVAWFDCQVFARLATGDRTFFWADVLAAGRARDEAPAREQDLLPGASDEQKRQLSAERDADIRRHRPLWEAWRQALPAWLVPASVAGKGDKTQG